VARDADVLEVAATLTEASLRVLDAFLAVETLVQRRFLRRIWLEWHFLIL